MRSLDWNDLRHLLAVARGGTLADAAKALGVDDSTVSRRVARLEALLEARLFERAGDGRLRPTSAGAAAVARAERMELEAEALRDGVAGADAICAGRVRLTSVPLLVNRLLVPALPGLLERHPALHLELVADPSDLSLRRREADMALRLARPRSGGRSVLARRIGTLRYGTYAAASLSADAAAALPWVTYDEAFAHLPQARWIAAALARGGAAARFVVNDGEALVEAVAAGLGKSLLPGVIAARDSRLARLPTPGGPVLERELWLLVHSELRRLARIEAVSDWLSGLLPNAAERNVG
ncbi:MAG: LysR family transcriptional regulator [Kiloniellales bacterium]|nr:LysR family transcriptional regulator [Kiloniellales bacterium]